MFGMIENAELLEGRYDQEAAVVRDTIIKAGFEPTDRKFIAGLLLGWVCASSTEQSYALSLGDLAQALGPLVANSIVNAEICRKWLDGEMPMLSLADMLGFD